MEFMEINLSNLIMHVWFLITKDCFILEDQMGIYTLGKIENELIK